MKKILSFIFVLIFSSSCLSQEIKIAPKALPAVVLQAFRTAYPHARINGVTKELDKGETYYEISCKDSLTSRTISFNSDGKITETEEDLKVDKLPDAVTNAISKQYTKGKILRIEESIKDSKTTYEILLKVKNKKFEVVFSPDGNIVSAK